MLRWTRFSSIMSGDCALFCRLLRACPLLSRQGLLPVFDSRERQLPNRFHVRAYRSYWASRPGPPDRICYRCRLRNCREEPLTVPPNSHVEPMRNGRMANRVGAFSHARKLQTGCSSSQANGPKKWLVANHATSTCIRAQRLGSIWRKRRLQCFLGYNNGVLKVVIPIPEALPPKAREASVTEGAPAKAETTQWVSARWITNARRKSDWFEQHLEKKTESRRLALSGGATACKSSAFRFIFFST